jgi:hypothetical protein
LEEALTWTQNEVEDKDEATSKDKGKVYAIEVRELYIENFEVAKEKKK